MYFFKNLEKYFIKDGDDAIIIIVNNHDQRPKLSTTQILQWWSSHGQAMHNFNIHNFLKKIGVFLQILQIVLQKVTKPQRWNAVFTIYMIFSIPNISSQYNVPHPVHPVPGYM